MTQNTSRGYLDMELLRFTTAGSVDDGKSTLIGRLLYDSKSIFEDQLEAVKKASLQKGDEHINLALFTDGLRSERQQGITIDVAYRYFYTPKRKFIIADTPGHIQYTRNMVTGASTAHAAVILVDARNGVTEQTRRHYYIAWLLGIKHIIVCINKMDLVHYSEEVFLHILDDVNLIGDKLPGVDLHFIPISALLGDNVVEASGNMPWYQGPTLLQKLESIDVRNHLHEKPLRMLVQYVIRPISDKYHDYRGYAGRIESGTLRVGDEVIILPSGMSSRITSMHVGDTFIEEAIPPMSVAITLADDIDVERGNIIVHPGSQPLISNAFEATICWMNPVPLRINQLYTIRQTTSEAKCKIINQHYRIDINSLEQIPGENELKMNEIGVFSLKVSRPLVFDSYRQNRATGSFILIDEATNETVGVGMIQ
ncbi:MAG: sulfate adenylyltransferase subunit 1 [Bacteroidales bacterium]|jgi:sulfate adenylyltransferase subunit 1|nr:sulfate adenylyltransferase subunit 1 [Bacteroidales bacterium]MDN5329257.1 sulfate adenylyltransferase subunit 1 [Bacteroidales bacterium]